MNFVNTNYNEYLCFVFFDNLIYGIFRFITNVMIEIKYKSTKKDYLLREVHGTILANCRDSMYILLITPVASVP